ncbi:hypothetical protein Glove_712g17 [Diversispora epigaea]|nr:hypothetical protein Glove_712g17 [Diversispora epigaea]
MEMMFAMKIPHGICTDPQFINTPDRKIIRKVKNFEDKNLIDTPFNFWHTRDKEIGFPKRVALCVSDAYESGTFPNHLRAGLNVTSLNVPSIGSLLMWEINRIMNTIQNNNNTTTATTTATATATTT